MTRERGEGGNVRRKSREARAPGRWRRAASYLLEMWFISIDGGILPTQANIIDYDTYLRFNDYLLNHIIDFYELAANDFGSYKTADWEKVRTPYVRSAFSFDEFMEIAPQVLEEHIKVHPRQSTLQNTGTMNQNTGTMNPNLGKAPTIVGPAQQAPCMKCYKTPTWRVSIQGQRYLEAFCADHLRDLGLTRPDEEARS